MPVPPLTPDRVYESSASSGTGAIVLAGAQSGGYQTFATKCANGQQMYYAAVDTANHWEVGIGTYNSGSNSLTRTQPLDGSSGPFTLVNFAGGGLQVWADEPGAIVPGGGETTGFVRGLALKYATSTTVTIGAGSCRDSADQVILALASAQTVTVTTNGAINGNDAFAGTGTVSTTSSSGGVTGSGTSFTTQFGSRAGVGTISSSGAAVTGVGTTFLSTVAVADLIGNATIGWLQVVAVNSDTSLTLVQAPGVAFSTSAFSVIESPTMQVAGQTAAQVKIIVSNTSLNLVANSSATASGVGFTIGVVPTTATIPATGVDFLFLWIGYGATGTGVYVSTQRTTPYGIAGYNLFVRRVGSLLINAVTIVPFDQYGLGEQRNYQFEVQEGANNTHLLLSGTATTWTQVTGSTCIPPSAIGIIMNLAIDLPSAQGQVYGSVRKRGMVTGDNTTRRPLSIANQQGIANAIVLLSAECACDGAQGIEYISQALPNNGVVGQLLIDAIGYREQL